MSDPVLRSAAEVKAMLAHYRANIIPCKHDDGKIVGFYNAPYHTLIPDPNPNAQFRYEISEVARFSRVGDAQYHPNASPVISSDPTLQDVDTAGSKTISSYD